MQGQTEAVEIMRKAFVVCKQVSPAVKTGYLYGSYARGDFHSESDVDILLTAALTQEEISRLRMRIAAVASELSLAHNVTVSITVKPEEQFRKYADASPFYRNVLKEGIPYAG